MSLWSSLIIVTAATLASGMIRFWLERAQHVHHPDGKGGYLRDCLLCSVALFLMLGGLLFLLHAGLGFWSELFAFVAWAILVIVATSLTPPLRRAQTRLLQTRRAAR